MTYTIRTDAVLATGIEAANMDTAAAQFAAEEGFAGVETARELCEAVDAIGDGAWCWIEDDDTGERIESSESAP